MLHGVPLQTLDRDARGAEGRHVHMATSKSAAMKGSLCSHVAWIPTSIFKNLSYTENAFRPQIGEVCIGIGDFSC